MYMPLHIIIIMTHRILWPASRVARSLRLPRCLLVCCCMAVIVPNVIPTVPSWSCHPHEVPTHDTRAACPRPCATVCPSRPARSTATRLRALGRENAGAAIGLRR